MGKSKTRKIARNIDRPTETEKVAIRSAIDEIVISDGSGQYVGELHIPHPWRDGQPLCSDEGVHHKAEEGGWETVDKQVYPPGYRSWCRYCVNEWRDRR